MPQGQRARSREKAPVVIPDKLYFRIGEVSRLTRTEAYVLRFWEKEFPMLKPVKSSTGHRMYRRKDVELVLEIKQLLYRDGFTIDGARKKLRTDSKQDSLPFGKASLGRVRDELEQILKILGQSRK